MTEEKKGPSGAAAGLGASLPVLFTLVCCCTLPLATGGDYDRFERRIEEAGIWFWVVLGCAALGGLIVAVLVLLSGRGMRVPVALPIFAAALPWLAGSAGTAATMLTVNEAVANVDASSRAMILAKGISEATTATVMGAWLSTALLSGVAVGLAICAVGQRAPERSGLGALGGIASTLPMLGIAMWVTLATPATGALLILATLGAMIACGVAAVGAGKDEPHRRSAALAGGAAIATGLAFVAAAIVVHTSALIQGFAAIAFADGPSRGRALVTMAGELVPAQLASTWGALAALVPVIGVGGWAMIRSGVSSGRIAGGVAAILVAAIFPASHAAVSSYVRESMAAVRTMAWEEVEGFEPIAIRGAQSVEYCDPRVLLSADGVRARGGPPVPVSDAAGVGAILRDVLGPPAPSEPADRNRYGIEGDAPTFGLPARVLDVAIDARVTGDALRAFVDHARTAGATAICVAGTAGSGPTAAERELVERNAPMLAAFTRSAAGIHLQLPDESEAAADPVLYHATVTGEGTITLSPRTGAGAPAIELAQADGSGLRPEPARTDDGRAYLGIGDGTNAGRYVTVASLAANAGLTPVVVTGAIPGDPDQPLAAAPPEGAIGLGMLGRIGADPSSAGVGRAGSPTVRGSLGREVVQRVMRRNITRIRYCYERELATSPSLSGRVETQFVIGPAGAVTTATVEGAGTPDAMRSCIETALRAMQFPQPRGGGIVIVDYPFVFEPA